MKLLKSKIFWVQILMAVIPIIALIANTYPTYAIILGLIGNALTIILRQLQGRTIKIGSRKIKM